MPSVESSIDAVSPAPPPPTIRTGTSMSRMGLLLVIGESWKERQGAGARDRRVSRGIETGIGIERAGEATDDHLRRVRPVAAEEHVPGRGECEQARQRCRRRERGIEVEALQVG